MIIEREWAMANKHTFQIRPIRGLIQSVKLDVLEQNPKAVIIDPFPYESKIDVFDYLKQFKANSVDLALVDPPYTKRQVSEHYKEMGIKINGWHTSSGWTAKVKYEVGRVVKVGGKAITFGYNSTGIGRRNGFKVDKVLVVCHGGDHYDTICTVETKIENRLIPIQEGNE